MVIMTTIIVFLLSLALTAVLMWSFAAHYILWAYWQYKKRVHYRIIPNPSSASLHSGSVLVMPQVNLAGIIFIRFITRLPIFAVYHEELPTGWMKRLLWRNRISLMAPSRVQAWHERGILVLAEYDYHAQSAFIRNDMPLYLGYVCGAEDIQRKALTQPVWQWMQAYFVKYAPANEWQMSQALQQFMAHAWMAYIKHLPSLTELWLLHAKMGGKALAVADSTGTELTYHRFVTAVWSLQQKISRPLQSQQRIGICLPPSVAGCSTVMAVLSLGKTIINLNYTASSAALQSAIVESGLSTILTSRRFMENLEKRGFNLCGAFAGTQLLYLEDLKQQISKLCLLTNYLRVKLLRYEILRELMLAPVQPEDVAAILFSSGSEGKPKGVELTHENIIGNAKQSAAILEISASDVMVGVLPIFHAFGLTATLLVPLIEGMPLVCHPDPREGEEIGRLVQKYKATILFGTSTFLRLYIKSKRLTADQFASLRVVVSGAERLAPEVRSQFLEKFGKDIFEGYGTTELSPVGTVNRPDVLGYHVRQKQGTVGRVIPGSMVRVVDPDTLVDMPVGEAGLIIIAGINVMKGYLNNPEKTAESIIENEGLRWYKTGDKGYLDQSGFLTIQDRYSRFAKLGGEMVGLTAVEQQIMQLLPVDADIEVLAVALADSRKGERIVLLFAGALDVKALRVLVLHSEMSNLAKPDEYIRVDHIPKLGSGKTDFAAAKKLALDLTRR